MKGEIDMGKLNGGYQMIKFNHDVTYKNGVFTLNEEDANIIKDIIKNGYKPVLLDFIINDVSNSTKTKHTNLFNLYTSIGGEKGLVASSSLPDDDTGFLKIYISLDDEVVIVSKIA